MEDSHSQGDSINHTQTPPTLLPQINLPNIQSAFIPAQYSAQHEIDNLRLIFELFDHTNSGTLSIEDLQEMAISLGKNPQLVVDIISSMDQPTKDGMVTFDEFSHIIKQLLSTQEINENGEVDELAEYEKRRMSFGAMLPRNVYFTPDNKVLDLLKLIDDYHKKQEKLLNYMQAKQAKDVFKFLAQREFEYQQNQMQVAQRSELESVESAQRDQFLQFSQAWDKYMADYEAAAYTSLEKLKERHDKEISHLKSQYLIPSKYTHSRELMELRNFEKKHFAVKEYEKAEQYKRIADKLEMEERKFIEEQNMIKFQKEEQKLRMRQQAALNSLLKRIQRDRDEQLKHRMQDSQKMIQRNRNLLMDIVQRQQLESKKTLEFLKYSLGKRSQSHSHVSKSSLPKNSTTRLPLITKSFLGGESQQSANKNSSPFLTVQKNQQESPYNTPMQQKERLNGSFVQSSDKISERPGGDRTIQYMTPHREVVSSIFRKSSENKSALGKYSPPSLMQQQTFPVPRNGNFQITDTVVKNYKKIQKMQLKFSRYGVGALNKTVDNQIPLMGQAGRQQHNKTVLLGNSGNKLSGGTLEIQKEL